MSNYDASIGPMVQSSTNSKTKKTGAAILGGLVGLSLIHI